MNSPNNNLNIGIKLIDSDEFIPCYMHEGDAAMDLRSTIDIELAPFERAVIPCGFSMSIPDGYAALVLPRSGMAARNGLTVINTPGLIDSGYRGEIQAAMINLDPANPYLIHKGDRIAQLAIIAVPRVTISISESLDSTQRGADGFGSSGIH